MKKTSSLLFFAIVTAILLTSFESYHKMNSAYNDVTIGNQVWMQENLNVNRFRNGDPIPQAKTNTEWIKAGDEKKPAWCYYNNDSTIGSAYGKLYNWYAVTDKRGIAPVGYHIPSESDWTNLRDFLGGEKTAGAKIKSKTEWLLRGNGTDSSGLGAVPGGYRNAEGVFYAKGLVCNWWSYTEAFPGSGFYHSLNYESVRFGRLITSMTLGLSVRCIKD